MSLADARQAVEDQHAHQLQLIGINTGMPEPGRITAHQTTGHQLTRRTEEILYPVVRTRSPTPPRCFAGCWRNPAASSAKS